MYYSLVEHCLSHRSYSLAYIRHRNFNNNYISEKLFQFYLCFKLDYFALNFPNFLEPYAPPIVYREAMIFFIS